LQKYVQFQLKSFPAQDKYLNVLEKIRPILAEWMGMMKAGVRLGGKVVGETGNEKEKRLEKHQEEQHMQRN
jgi:hypothetical protein